MSVKILNESDYFTKRKDWVYRLYNDVSIDLMDVALEEAHFVQGSSRYTVLEKLMHSIRFYTYQGARNYLENGDEIILTFDVNSDKYIVSNLTQLESAYREDPDSIDESFNVQVWDIFEYTPKEAVEAFLKLN